MADDNSEGFMKTIFILDRVDGTPLFFPVDGDTFTPSSKFTPATIPPPYVAWNLHPLPRQRF